MRKWHELVDDVISVILLFLEEFYRADAAERVHNFRVRYFEEWTAVMASVRANTPVYSLDFTFGRITVLSPDCCPASFLPFLPTRKICRHVR
jgi:hypothetical protein